MNLELLPNMSKSKPKESLHRRDIQVPVKSTQRVDIAVTHHVTTPEIKEFAVMFDNRFDTP